MHTFSNQALLMKYKDYTIAQQKDIEKKKYKIWGKKSRPYIKDGRLYLGGKNKSHLKNNCLYLEGGRFVVKQRGGFVPVHCYC